MEKTLNMIKVTSQLKLQNEFIELISISLDDGIFSFKHNAS